MATKAQDWKKKRQAGQVEIDLPSGNQCLAQFLQPEAFISGGFIPDKLTDMVTKAINTKKGLPPSALKEMTKDPKQISDAMYMMDKVLCYVVVQPTVLMPPTCGMEPASKRGSGVKCGKYFDVPEHRDTANVDYHTYLEDARDPDVLYADEVDLEDKVFVFQWAVGGVADVESFREGYQATLESVSAGKAVEGKTKRTSRNK